MDEELIKEVEQHAVIYNRQKYFLNSSGPGQYETKDEAWGTIAHKLRTDVDTCKKRWKYLRERYVQQLKQGIPATYEHLSRPYLEKMKFLDQHIQPRKSYRNVSNFLPSPNGPFAHEYLDSRSNGSMHNAKYANYPENLVSSIKTEPTFQNFSSAAGASPTGQLHSSSHPPSHASLSSTHQHPQFNHSGLHSGETRDNDAVHIPSSSSSLKSPLSSPQMVEHQDISENIKRARLSTNNIPHAPHHDADDSSDNDNDEGPPLSIQQQQQQQQQQHEHLVNEAARRRNCRLEPPQTNNNDFLYSFYQRLMPPSQVRSSEQLLGELVTSELLKMSREKRKTAQRRILEVLFFDE